MPSYLFVLADHNGADIGVLRRVTSRNVSFRFNGPCSAGFTVPVTSGTARQLQPGLSRLKVFRQFTPRERVILGTTDIRRLCFYGSLPETGVSEDTTGGQVVTFMDPLWMLGERFTSPNAHTTGLLETYTAQDAEAILWGMVDTQNQRPGGDTWIRRGGSTTGRAYTVTFDRQTVLSQAQALAGLVDGPDFMLTPRDGWAETRSRVMGDLMVYPRAGVTSPASFRYGKGLHGNCARMGRTYSRVVTLAQVTGSTIGVGVPLVDTYGNPGESLYGLREHYGAESDATTPENLSFRTRGLVAAYERPRQVIEVGDPLANAPQFGVDYQLGDSLQVACRHGAMVFHVTARVHGVDISLDQAGKQSTRITTAEV